MTWYWIIVQDNGRPFLHDTPYKRIKEAERVNDDRYKGAGRIIPLDTSDRIQAARILRQQLASNKSTGWGRNFKHGKA